MCVCILYLPCYFSPLVCFDSILAVCFAIVVDDVQWQCLFFLAALDRIILFCQFKAHFAIYGTEINAVHVLWLRPRLSNTSFDRFMHSNKACTIK